MRRFRAATSFVAVWVVAGIGLGSASSVRAEEGEWTTATVAEAAELMEIARGGAPVRAQLHLQQALGAETAQFERRYGVAVTPAIGRRPVTDVAGGLLVGWAWMALGAASEVDGAERTARMLFGYARDWLRERDATLAANMDRAVRLMAQADNPTAREVLLSPIREDVNAQVEAIFRREGGAAAGGGP